MVHLAQSSLTMFLPYSALRPLNVDSTHEVLRFTARGRAKRVHLLSSLRAAGFGATIAEAPLPDPPRSAGHFGVSKWIAEELVRRAVERGIDAAVYRVGNLVDDSQIGRCDPDDYFSRLISSPLAIGAVLRTTLPVVLTPADAAAGAIVAGIGGARRACSTSSIRRDPTPRRSASAPGSARPATTSETSRTCGGDRCSSGTRSRPARQLDAAATRSGSRSRRAERAACSPTSSWWR